MPSERLIERGRLAYQALACREKAARYQAAAANLAEAIALAESGDKTKLEELLNSNDYRALVQEQSSVETPTACLPINQPPTAIPSVRAPTLTTPTEKAPSETPCQQSPDTHHAEWSSMLEGARLRCEQADPKPTIATHSVQPTVVSKPQAKDTKPAPVHKKNSPSQACEARTHRQSSAIKGSAQNRSKSTKTPKAKSNPLGLDIWLSVAIHGVLLVVLGLWVVVTVKQSPALSVVAATVESNEVLLETPMESISKIDSIETDSQSIESIDSSDIQLPVNTDSLLVENVDLGIDQMAQSNSISQQIASAAAAGNKILQGAEFFGSKAIGNRFIYIVDASPSMRRDRAFEAAKGEILRSLQSMKPTQRFAILFFGGAVETLELAPGQKIEQLVPATPENIQKAIIWLAKVTIQKDGRPPIEAVKSALELDPDGIFLLFDGDTKLDNWTQMVRKLNTNQGLLSDGSTQVPIHVIHFFRDEYQRSMQLLASENAGTYRFLPRPESYPGP